MLKLVLFSATSIFMPLKKIKRSSERRAAETVTEGKFPFALTRMDGIQYMTAAGAGGMNDPVQVVCVYHCTTVD